MCKRLIWLPLLLLVVSPEIRASDFFSRFSISLKPGGVLALGGNYTDYAKLKDAVNIGIGFGPGFRYEINENIYIDAGYAFNWMSVKKDYQLFAYKETHPAFNLHMFTLNATFYLKSGYLIEPYITLGGGICPWKFSGSPIGGETWPAPGNPGEKFSGISIGLNIGLGVEVFIWKHVTVTGEVKYNYVFSRNPEKFGTDDFTQQDFLGAGIGIVYYFKKNR